jgi:MYXO-CTERM domain-containing protein
LGALGLLGFVRPAEALVTEPDGFVVPRDASLSSDLTCCNNTVGNMSLPALFDFLGEGFNYLGDGVQDPQYFSPLCGFTGMLILHGGGCLVDFGWYNVDTNNPNPPEIFPLVSTTDLTGLATFTPKVPTNGQGCNDPPFCTNNADWHPVQGSGSLANIRNSPNYRGGYVGFAVRANPNSACTQSKYSEPRYNMTTNWGGNWISMVMWKSTKLSNTYYVGVEDLPMAPDNFKGYVGASYQNDGDFNDFVYVVQGIGCPQAGQPCTVGGEGACGLGLTECDATGTKTICVPQLQASAELCDNLDNDCNGLVDDEAPCPSGQICFHGSCVGLCSSGEFQCPPGTGCDTGSGVCVETACINVSCPQSQVCIGGQCLGGCEGVTCPEGQVCQLGRCFDACANRTCSAGKVCEGGVCLDDCTCRACPSGRQCASNGHCVLQGCAAPNTRAPLVCPNGAGQPLMRCGPDANGNGACVSICQGVVCPGGADCDPMTGQCGTPKPGWTPGTGGTAGGGSIFGNGASAGSDNTGGGESDLPLGDLGKTSGCGCRTAGGPRGALAGLFALGLGLACFRRRRTA